MRYLALILLVFLAPSCLTTEQIAQRNRALRAQAEWNYDHRDEHHHHPEERQRPQRRLLICDKYPAYKCSPGYKGD